MANYIKSAHCYIRDEDLTPSALSLAQSSTLVLSAVERAFLEWFFWYMDGQTDFEILLMQQWTVAERRRASSGAQKGLTVETMTKLPFSSPLLQDSQS